MMQMSKFINQLFCRHTTETKIIKGSLVEVCLKCDYKKVVGANKSRRDFLRGTVGSAIAIAIAKPEIDKLVKKEVQTEEIEQPVSPYEVYSPYSISAYTRRRIDWAKDGTEVHMIRCQYCDMLNKEGRAICEYCNEPLHNNEVWWCQ